MISRKDLEKSSQLLPSFLYSPSNCLEGPRKISEDLVTLSNLQAENGARDLQNMKEEC
jgi:hypothetical protein